MEVFVSMLLDTGITGDTLSTRFSISNNNIIEILNQKQKHLAKYRYQYTFQSNKVFLHIKSPDSSSEKTSAHKFLGKTVNLIY